MNIEPIIDGKSITRIHKGYKVGSKDWEAELDMLLPDGYTCKDCRHCERCYMIFGQKETDTSCQFYPSRASLATTKTTV